VQPLPLAVEPTRAGTALDGEVAQLAGVVVQVVELVLERAAVRRVIDGIEPVDVVPVHE
jgi:hypothetical protein